MWQQIVRQLSILISTGTTGLADLGLIKRVRLSNTVAMAATLAGTIYVSVFLIFDAPSFSIPIGIAVFAFCGVLLLNMHGHTYLSRFFLLLSFHGIVDFFAIALADVFSNTLHLMTFPHAMLPFVLFGLHERKSIAFGLTLAGTTYWLVEKHGVYWPNIHLLTYDSSLVKAAETPIVAFALFLVILYYLIRENVRLEGTLQETTNRLLLQINSAPCAIIEFAADGRVVGWNPVAAAMYGYTKEEAMQLTYPALVAESVRNKPNFGEGWRALLATKNPTFGESICVRKDGSEFYGEARCVALRNGSDNASGILAFTFDVSDRIKNAQLLQEQEAKSLAAAKLASIGEMASGVAHEINTPLAIIVNRARAGRKKSTDRPDLVENFSSIEKVAMRIAKIIGGLKTLSRNGEADPMEECRVSTIISDAVDLCREKIKNAGVDLREAVVPDHFLVSGRAVQLSQVILNLISNAVDALGERSPESSEKNFIEIEVQATPTTFEIRVINNGPLIPAEVREKIMHPFFTTKPVGKGTGLGLSISQSIIQQHGGQLILDDASGLTTFVISLPRIAVKEIAS